MKPRILARQTTGHAYDWDQQRLNRIRRAQYQSDLATARLQGMKLRAELEIPTAATGGFPYPARTCAEWTLFDSWNDRRMKARNP